MPNMLEYSCSRRYSMHNFSTHNELMSCFLSINEKEKAKLDKYLEFLDETGVSKIIDEELNSSQETRGRNPFNPYKLFATIKPKIRPAEINFKKNYYLNVNLAKTKSCEEITENTKDEIVHKFIS